LCGTCLRAIHARSAREQYGERWEGFTSEQKLQIVKGEVCIL